MDPWVLTISLLLVAVLQMYVIYLIWRLPAYLRPQVDNATPPMAINEEFA